ncbi:MAG TPA: Minf_1886 family protein [Gemmatimonadales bacterium]|nr:Minf_1886 family protein [Gemmatimonadales bacterium]
MNDITFVADVLTRIRSRSDQFDERAYLFVLGAIEYVQGRLPARRHLGGAEVAWACRDLGWEQFGLLAPAVLSHWGITSTDAMGRVVFTMVEAGLLVAQPGDSLEDFAGVYDFAEAFRAEYIWRGAAAQQLGT